MPKRRHSQDTALHRRQQNAERRRRYQDMPQMPTFVGRSFPPQVSAFSLGPMDLTCPDCHALRFPGELFNCCHKGKVELPPLGPCPPEFRELLSLTDARSQHFLKYVRNYNSAMAFASFGANIDNPPHQWNPSFKIHGQVYHLIGALHPPDGSAPKYSQLYIMEADQAVQACMQAPENDNCRQDIMATLTAVLNIINPYAAAYNHMHEVEKASIEEAERNNETPPYCNNVQ